MATATGKNINTAIRGALIDQSDGTTAQQVIPVGSASANSASAPTTYQESASVTKANLKATAGSVFAVLVTNANAAARYIQLHNKATAPAGGDTAQWWQLVPAGTAANPGTLLLDNTFFSNQEYFTTGIGFAVSTTATTFTDSATASDHTVTIRYS